MELTLKRIAKKKDYTIGQLFINDSYFCDTLEDTDRGLYSYMTPGEISRLKVQNETAIPYGTYKVRLSKSYRFNKLLPELMQVPGYIGVRIHSGNTKEDTQGCILVGENKEKGKVLNSRKTMSKLMEHLNGQDEINLTIE